MPQAPDEIQSTLPSSDATTCKAHLMASRAAEGLRRLMNDHGGDELRPSLNLFGEAMALLEEIEHSSDLVVVDGSNFCCSPCPPATDCGSRTLTLMNMTRRAEWGCPGIPALSADRSISVYNVPIAISASDDLDFCRPALLFNMSLIHHAVALRMDSLEVLQVALDLYSASFQAFLCLFAKVPPGHLRSCQPEEPAFHIQMYALAAWNNMAHLYLCCRRQDIALPMLAWLKEVVQDLYHRALSTEELDGGLLDIARSFLFNDYSARNPNTGR